ncbi:hypothetical protein DEO72_LG3g717 [Vigna unguiculata]|uniref:Uncharacterized protein n=1 Tax=Vigna unguiculata TaxID=3917 RepID=A0A4D6LCY0_VIGUN|nr:hypothetical protein DEO72_LG3g716 [Vigna unguiculata]QCD86196.1 hypothetical protein DEO72_LG3g717 [Vigna unguiculata]
MTQMSRTTSAATMTRFLMRARRAVVFRRVQWWPDVVVAAAEWVGEEEREERN